MNPIKLKLNWDYFLEKVEKLVNDEQKRLNIQVRRTGAIITNLKKYIHDRKIINDNFWGYGIERLTNGIKTIEQSENPKSGYLITLFKLEDDSLKLFFIRLTYSTGRINELLRPLNLKSRFITKASYSIDSLYIYSEELDKPLQLKIDTAKNARYYSDEIHNLKDNLPQKTEPKEELSFTDKARMVLQELKEKPERKGELTELLVGLKIDFILDDIVDYSNYFEESNYARTALNKDGCFLTLTNFGLDYLQENELDFEEEKIPLLKKDLIESGQVSPETNPNIQKPNKNRDSIKRDIQWVISALIALGIFYLGYLNFKSKKSNPEKVKSETKDEDSTKKTMSDTIKIDE